MYYVKYLSGIIPLVMLTLLSACGGGSGGSGGSGGGGGGDDEDDGTSYNYTVASATWLTGGQQVAVIRFGLSGNCSAPTGVTSPITRVGAGTVNTPGTVSFSFTTEITPPMVESVYIDNNASGNLDNGDRVWGDNPNDLAAACFDAINADQTFDWEVVAAQFQAALGLSQPSIIYTGGVEAFRSEPGSEPELMMNNAIIVDGDGYDSIITVSIDINLGSAPNSINPGGKEIISVAVLGSIDYDATQIDFSTVGFGEEEAQPAHDGHVEDVNADGFMDMVFHFKTRETGIVCGDTEATLTGETFGGTPFTGTDTLKTVGCN
jgi:hypothetical protein